MSTDTTTLSPAGWVMCADGFYREPVDGKYRDGFWWGRTRRGVRLHACIRWDGPVGYTLHAICDGPVVWGGDTPFDAESGNACPRCLRRYRELERRAA